MASDGVDRCVLVTLLVASVLGATAAGCGARAPVGPAAMVAAPAAAQAATRARADALAAEGCHAPMAEAVSLYRGLGEAWAERRAFDLAVRLAVRERRLGLYPGRHAEIAADLAARLPGPDVATAMEVVEVVPWRHGTRAPVVPTAGSFGALRERIHRLYRALEPRAAADPTSTFLLMHLLAAYPLSSQPPDVPVDRRRFGEVTLESWPWVEPHLARTDVALAWYDLRGVTAPDDWAIFQAEHPRCDEVFVFLADAEIARRRLGSADAALAAAVTALPDLVPARIIRAEMRAELGDYAEALELLTPVTARIADHREVWLGTLVALSRLGHYDEAIAAADTLLTLGEWYLGEAHYWKAWNRFEQGRLGDAEASLVDARRLLHNSDVYYLGGLIAYRGEQWPRAREEFGRALDVDATHCDARFMQGAVLLLERTWPAADEAFMQAEVCLRTREPLLEAALADVDRAAFDAARRAALRARRQQALDGCREQQRWARYNRAVALTNDGRRDEGRALADALARQAGPVAAAARDLLVQLGVAASGPR